MFDLDFAINEVVPNCLAAYDVSKMKSDQTLVGKIEPLDFGFVSIDTHGQLKVNIRGTEGSQPDAEWIADFDAIPITNSFGLGTVHKGFQDIYSRIRDCVIDLISSVKFEDALFTGHSLGAAVATIAAADFASSRHCGSKTFLYTLASPRVGKHDFASWYDSIVEETNRIVNFLDIVPRIPTCSMRYEHVGHEVVVFGSKSLDLRVNHAIETGYLPGLEKLTPKTVQMYKVA